MHRRTYHKGDTLFHEGDAGDLLYRIERGRVAIRITTTLGDVVTLAILGRGDTFGEQALSRPRARDGERGRARGRRGAHVAPPRLRAPATHDPTIDRVLVDVLAARCAAFRATCRRRCSSRPTVVCCAASPNCSPCTPTTAPSHRSRCRCVRTTSRRWPAPRGPTVNRLLQRLQSEGIIALRRGHLAVLDPAVLTKRAG